MRETAIVALEVEVVVESDNTSADFIEDEMLAIPSSLLEPESPEIEVDRRLQTL